MESPISEFVAGRFGLFIHFGLYSLLGRGEWAVNREGIGREELRELSMRFDPRNFDADEIAELAVAGGMRYLIFTTMHHDGFRMYHSELTDFCSTKTASGRDFVAEIVTAGRKRGLKIALYHSLNNWFDQPDAVEALESPGAYEIFIGRTFERIRELVTRYDPIDVLWYDGWWPFDALGWQSEKMNGMVRKIQPHILFNGRNGLPGDFATPEQHITAPHPWRPWEACFTLNDSWGYNAGDHSWKSSVDVIKMLARVAQGRGNLALNIGPRGDGSIPEESVRIIREVGGWLGANGESVFGVDTWSFDLRERGSHRGDWCSFGSFTAKGNRLYLTATALPEDRIVLTGLEMKVNGVRRLDAGELPFHQDKDRLTILETGPRVEAGSLPPVLCIDCDRPPSIYKTGGMRIPRCDHPRYDPVESDLAAGTAPG